MNLLRKTFKKIFKTKRKERFSESIWPEGEIYLKEWENLRKAYEEIQIERDNRKELAENEELKERKALEEEKLREKPTSKYSILIKNIELNRAKIIKEQKEGKRREQEKLRSIVIRKALGDVGQCKEKQSYTERLLLKAMNKIGLFPEEQYEIGDMHVDFAFPDKRIVIEVEGPPHDKKTQKIRDIKRGYVLRDLGWSVWKINAEKVYKNPLKMAYRVKFILEGRGQNN